MTNVNERVPSSTPHIDFYRVGDIAFVLPDIPVIVKEIVAFPSGADAAALVEYIGVGYTSGTVGVESLSDLSAETHQESEDRWEADNYESLGTWPKPRNIEDFPRRAILSIPGVATRESIAKFHRTMAKAHALRTL